MELAAFALMLLLSLAIGLAAAWVALDAVMAVMTGPVAPPHEAARPHVTLGPRAIAA